MDEKRKPNERRGRMIRRRLRGLTLMELMIAAALSAAIIGLAVGVYATGTRTFYSDQAQSYTQFRARVSMDDLARDIRSARSVLATHSGHSSNSGQSGEACLILRTPAQDSATMSVFQYGSSSATPNATVMDVIIYRHDETDKTLLRTVVPATGVLASDGATRSSFRAAMSDQVVGANVEDLEFTFRDRDGQPLAAGLEHRTAAVDVMARVGQGDGSGGIGPAVAMAISGVRLRNMRSGSIPGTVTGGGAPLANAHLEAVYTSATGAYNPDTTVEEAYSNASGGFEIYGLEPGTYSVIASAPGRSTRTITGIAVPEEDAAQSVTIALP